MFSRGGVLQKHFRRDELLGDVVTAGLQVEGIEKVEYPWWTEFSAGGDEAAVAEVAEALGGPHPHDWLLLATVGTCTQPKADG